MSVLVCFAKQTGGVFRGPGGGGLVHTMFAVSSDGLAPLVRRWFSLVVQEGM